MTLLRNIITDRRVDASEQVGGTEYFFFDILAISLSIFDLIALLLFNILFKGVKEVDNII